MKFLIVLSTLILVSCVTAPKPDAPSELGVKTCGTIPGTKNPAKYCHWKTCSESKGSVIYTHGLSESEQSGDAPGNPILGTTGHLQDFLKLAKANCYDLVIPSYGTSWIIRPPGTLAQKPPSPAWSEYETKVLGFLVEKLALKRPYVGLGVSMGGANGAITANLKPGFYDKLILSHPLITDFPPTSGFTWASILIGTHFTSSEWVIANPLNTIKTVAKSPPIFVIACKTDQFGLYDGPKRYAEAAKARGFDVVFAEDPSGCNHMTAPPESMYEWVKK